MAKVWEDFEKSCVDYLERHFGQYAHFTWKGKSDSTKSDIEVVTNSGKSFYIEAKHCPAQCGQFVLLPNIGIEMFDYSHLNATPINPYSHAIIEYMNQDFESFKNAGTRGKLIEMENGTDVFAAWIKNYYKRKETKYIITNNFEIFSIEDIENVFNISATYRVKRSGSGYVGKNNVAKMKNYIENNYPIIAIGVKGDRMMAISNSELHNIRFKLDGTEYMFSKRENVYEIRKLSNTLNANVIFSVEFEPQIDSISNVGFIDILTR
ncbi:MAG: hypothetical protein IJW19_02425 [Clostridia bacterium]|nr:hypothetical protein [Clostridia bacterium]